MEEEVLREGQEIEDQERELSISFLCNQPDYELKEFQDLLKREFKARIVRE